MSAGGPDVTPLVESGCELGEGPHFDALDNTAWWFDIVACKLHEYRFDDGVGQTHSLPRMASAMARIDDNRQLLAMEDGLYERHKKSGRLTLRHPLEDEMPATRSNDGRTHPSGRLWIGTMGRKAERNLGAIYCYDGSVVEKIFDGITIPNSICFTADGATAYFADSYVNRVWRVPVNPATALPTGEPELFLAGKEMPEKGVFDGSVVDRNGVLWNAAWGGRSVRGFAPDGTLVARHEIPAAQVTCPCFVGEKLDSLLVTTAWQGYSGAQRKADPRAGDTFLLKGGFSGIADPPFRPV